MKITKNAKLATLLALGLTNCAWAENPAWVMPVFSSMLIAIFVVLIVYIIVHVLHLEQFKMILRDELAQVVAAILMVTVLLSGIVLLQGWLAQSLCGAMDIGTCNGVDLGKSDLLMCEQVQKANGNCPSTIGMGMNDWAKSINEKQTKVLTDFTYGVIGYSDKVGEVSAKSGFANMLGVGMGIAGCSAYGAVRGPLGQLLNALGFGLMDLNAEMFLLNLNGSNAGVSVVLGLFLPAGILLRALHFTRKAGSAIIALSISLYILFPASLLFGHSIVDRYVSPGPGGANNVYYAADPSIPASNMECDPFDPDENVLVGIMNNLITGSVDNIIFWIIIRTMIITAFALSVTLGGAAALAHIMNTELDVSAIARLS
ncbi:MAG: hypothetical protein WC492_00915 [Candidatus Micrarchaeia archaeon]